MIVPDAIEPYVGWKALRIRGDGRLESPQQLTIWPVKQRLEGGCAKTGHFAWTPIQGEPKQPSSDTVTISFRKARFPKPDNALPPGWSWSWEQQTHAVPHPECTCGVYAVESIEQCLSYMSLNTVLCQIAIWGKTIAAHKGARGQYAYPQSMVIPHQLVDVAPLVADLYAIPCVYQEDGVPAFRSFTREWI